MAIKKQQKPKTIAEAVHSDVSRSFPVPKSRRIAVKIVNHLGDEVVKVSR